MQDFATAKNTPLITATATQMRALETQAVEGGISYQELMEHAGRAVAKEVIAHHNKKPTCILCGPGNNGGDGFVIAEILRAAGWPVVIASVLPIEDLPDLPRQMASKLEPLHTLAEIQPLLPECSIIIDALFGIGLSRNTEGELAEIINLVNNLPALRISVDIPSGIDSDSGQCHGVAVKAHKTYTFACSKPGHWLLPGYTHVGKLEVLDIGIPLVPEILHPQCELNHPDLWQKRFPLPSINGHKYTRGHSIIVGGTVSHSGAAMLAAEAALRVGSGLVTQLVPREALTVYASLPPKAIMTRVFEDESAAMLADERCNAWLIGPGLGNSRQGDIRRILEAKKQTVLDADALTCFADRTDELFNLLHPNCLLTPHTGEFSRLFPDLNQSSKVERCRAAAKRAGAVVVLKGADTVIAAPDGRATIHIIDAPQLATAGTGDVLAGLCTGLLAQGMPVFETATAAVWLHGQSGQRFGLGLIADDLPGLIPDLLRGLAGGVGV